VAASHNPYSLSKLASGRAGGRRTGGTSGASRASGTSSAGSGRRAIVALAATGKNATEHTKYHR
jgi:hypothetical protein